MKLTRKLLCLLLALVMVLPMIQLVHAQEEDAGFLLVDPLEQKPEFTGQAATQAQAGEQQHPSKEAIAAKWATVTQATSLYVLEPVVSAPYEPGELTDNFLESGITYLNYIRFVAGLPEVQLHETLCEDAQYGAVLLAAVDYLSHTPGKPADMDSDFYNRGYDATSSSNISARWGYAPLGCIQGSLQGCLDDSGDNNLATVGHRRWLLNPTLGKVGFGYAQSAEEWSYIVTPVFDRSGAGCEFDFISWPINGNQPTNLFNVKNPWSVTLNSAVYQTPSADSVKITITRVSDGKQWNFDSTTGQPTTHTNPYMIVNNQWYGLPNCIIFHPGSANVDSYMGLFRVNISGIYYTNGTAAEIEYEVDFFDIDSVGCDHSYTSSVTAPTCTDQGYTTYTCSKCGDSYVSDYTDPVDHVYEDGKCVWCGTGLPCENGHHVPGYSYPYETGFCEYCGIPCRTSGDTIWAIEEDGTMIVYGNGEMYAHDNNWTQYADRVTALVVEEGVTGMIHGFTQFEKLVSVYLPEGVTGIEKGCFGGCVNLEQVNFPESLTYLGSNSFHSCVKLKQVHLPAALESFGARPFGGCSNLTGIWVDEENPFYTNDQYGALYSKDMTQLIEVPGNFSGVFVIPETVNYIEWAAFDGCKNLTGVEIPDGVTMLQMNLFENCIALKSVTIPASVTDIWINAFTGCTALETITFEGDAPAIMGDCFQGVTATAYYPAGNETWTEEIMQNYGGTITWVPYGEVEEYTVTWKSATTSLNGTIDLNIYVVLSENLMDEEDAFVRFRYGNKVVDVPIAEGVESVSGGILRYRYSCPMYAKEVSEIVTVQVMKGEEVIGSALEYSIVTYCMNRINKSTNPAQVELCKALLNYAAAAQISLNYNTENLANADLEEADKILPGNIDVSDYAASITGSETGIKAKSATLMLESEVSVRVYFTLEEGYDISDFTFTIDGKVVEVQKNSTGWFIETDGIAAKDLDKLMEFSVGGITVTYGPMSYVHSKLTNPKTSADTLNLVKALYAYWQNAEALLG